MNPLRIFFFISCLAFTSPAHAGEVQIRSFDSFQNIPVLDNGRLKPLDTFARTLLLQLSAKDTYEHTPAIHWLARLLFIPASTKEDKVFLINNPDIAAALGIDADQHRRYSFSQLEKSYPKFLELYNAAFKIPEKQRSILEEEILRVFQNVLIYTSLTREMQFAFAHSDFTITNEGTAKILDLKTTGTYSFFDLALTADAMREATKNLEHADPTSWTPEQKEIMSLTKNLFQWSLDHHDLALAVIPTAGNAAGQVSSTEEQLWVSPWEAINTDFQNENTRQAIGLWRDMALSYTQGKQVEFDLEARRYLSSMEGHYNQNKFSLELLYNASRPFLIAKIFYIFTLIFFVVSFFSPGRIYYHMAWGSILAGFIPHTLALMARIVIMSRPPVTNLYETFIFVAFISVLLGLGIELANKRWLGLVVSGISGVALLFIASKYSAEGDTLKMLVAVLNSNFWLGTHVLTITMGYGATCVAGVVGHIWLLQKILNKDKEVLASTHKVLFGMLALALTLTFFGTNLGGIWADQSWGRFWGWDPKENGALMIVLWCAMLLHAKVVGLIDHLGLAVGAVLGMLVVMWAWFGVNLLGIGLHSYGFTSGVANTLALYAICEIMFLGVTTFMIRRKK